MNGKRGVAWVDLTVPDAAARRDFYAHVIGWSPTTLDMGGYDDFNMNDATSGNTVAGICHQRAGNADLPPVWMVYFLVDDLDRALEATSESGGQVISSSRAGGGMRYAMIRDPGGTVCALIASDPPSEGATQT